MDNKAASGSTHITPAAFDSFNTKLQTLALNATRNVLTLPGDIAFHRSIDSAFAKDIDVFSQRVLDLTNKLLNLVDTADLAKSKGKGKAKLESQDDVVDSFHSLVVDSMDQLLERTDMCLDEVLGKYKAPAIAVNVPAESVSSKKQKVTPKGPLDPTLQHAFHLSKPQLMFKYKPDNKDAPWYPSLSHKYNAKVPLGHVYTDGPVTTEDVTIVNHPYRYEITHYSPPPDIYKPCTPLVPRSFEDTPFTWVNTPAAFQAMLDKLKVAHEIAVDLEHHSYRSYSGFLCLMQISNRDEDWVVDLLTVREEVEALNEVFTDPSIVKVFHGAESDIVWLQQDFNVYVVGLFDTFHASKALDFPRHGLANLLEMYCDYLPDKRFQLADWRIRPLPEEMLHYARSDTHFLLYIYDNLRNALLDLGLSKSRSQSPTTTSVSSSTFSLPSTTAHALLNQVLSRSADTSLRVYEKEMYDATGGTGSGGWDTLARKWNKGLLLAGGPGVGIGAMQREVYKGVHAWREQVAREEDESVRYILPNHFLFQLAEQPPADMASLLGVFRTSVPPVLKRRGKDLLDVIRVSVKSGIALMNGGDIIVEANREVEVVGNPVENVIHGQEGAALQHDSGGDSVKLWGKHEHTPSASSSLFGFIPPMHPTSANALTTSISTLFGPVLTNQGASSLTSTKSENLHFKELLTKIHRTLVIVPAVPNATSTVITGDNTRNFDSDTNKVDPISGMQVEIPYVPASQRHSVRTAEETDTIVVVGQARQKKRKRTKAVVSTTDATGSEHAATEKPQNSQAKQDDDVETPFDFNAVPNILDDNPDTEDRKKKRQRKQAAKRGGTYYGDFPAPPKAHSELKSGNQSHTFK